MAMCLIWNWYSQRSDIWDDGRLEWCCTFAVVVGVFLLVVIRAQDFFILLGERRVCLARLRAATTTVGLWSVRRGQTQTRENGEIWTLQDKNVVKLGKGTAWLFSLKKRCSVFLSVWPQRTHSALWSFPFHQKSKQGEIKFHFIFV